VFYNTFIVTSMDHGRVFEPMLLLKFVGRSEGSLPGAVKSLAKDGPLGMELVKRGKMAFLPHKIRRPEQLKIIYDNIRRMEEEAQ
jgi:hypothetical protein